MSGRKHNATCGCAECRNYGQSYNPSAIHNQSCGCARCGNYSSVGSSGGNSGRSSSRGSPQGVKRAVATHPAAQGVKRAVPPTTEQPRQRDWTSSPAAEQKHWSCAACTFKNLQSAAKCETCDTEKAAVQGVKRAVATPPAAEQPRQRVRTSSPTAEQKCWSCAACTFENLQSAAKCEMCDTEKGNDAKDNKRSPKTTARRSSGSTDLWCEEIKKSSGERCGNKSSNTTRHTEHARGPRVFLMSNGKAKCELHGGRPEGGFEDDDDLQCDYIKSSGDRCGNKACNATRHTVDVSGSRVQRTSAGNVRCELHLD